jgi:hypothetical protein
MPKTYEPIASQTLGTASANITFSSIPSTYTDLRVVLVGTTASNGQDFIIQFNGDSTNSNYSIIQLSGNGSSASSARASYPFLAGTTSSTVQTPAFGDIMNYSNTTTYKTWLAKSGDLGNGYIQANVGLWRNTSAINQVLIRTVNGINLSIGTIATIYGIKAA